MDDQIQISSCPVCDKTGGYWAQKAPTAIQLQIELRKIALAFKEVIGLTHVVSMRYNIEINLHDNPATKQEIRSITENGKGEILIADTNSGRIRRLDRLGMEKAVPMLGNGERFFPVALAVLKGDYLAVATRPPEKNLYGKIFIFNMNTWCPMGEPFGEFQHVRAICDAGNERLMIIESQVKKLSVYDINGTRLVARIISSMGFPVGIAVYKDRIYISDNEHELVYVFSFRDVFTLPADQPLVPLTTIGQGVINFPYGIEINSEGLIFVPSNHGKTNLCVFDQYGRLLQHFFSEKKHTKMLAYKLLADGESSAFAFESSKVYIYKHPSRQ